MFQPFILHITCLWFAGTLAKPKHVGNAFTYLNLTKRLLSVTLSSGNHTFQDILRLIYFQWCNNNFHFNNLLLFSNKAMSSSFICLFLKSKSNIFASFIISMLRMTNLFFCFKIKEWRTYHECAFEFTHWIIWLSSSILIGFFK